MKEKTKTSANCTKQNQKSRAQKGITLIALVITIIVLLILAGVAINLALDSNGIFSRANEAIEKYNNGVAKEEGELQNLLNLGDEITNTVPEGWNMEKVSQIIRQGNQKAPIPKGFTVSSIKGENTISGGLVIYQGEEAVTDTDGDNNGTIDAQENRNQYVWIPVNNINEMIMCKKNTGDSVCDIELENGLLKCKTHPIETDTAEEWQKQIVGRLYIGTFKVISTPGPRSCTMDFTKKDQTYGAGNGCHEPNTVSDDASNGIELGTLQKDFYAMAKSVATYGGFYISRYEIGENGNSKKDQKVLTAASSDGSNYLGANRWYGLYTASKKDGSSTSPNSHMIWGSQYDQVIKFIGTETQIGHEEENYNPTTNQLSGTTTPMKNIYDLEGNYAEWTAEAYAATDRSYRGGFSTDAKNGYFVPAARRGSGLPTVTDFNGSSRLSLYL